MEEKIFSVIENHSGYSLFLLYLKLVCIHSEVFPYTVTTIFWEWNE